MSAWRLGLTPTQRLNRVAPTSQKRKREERSDAARFLLNGRSGGSDRSILERSKSSGITTGCVRWSMTGRRQGPTNCLELHVDRPDAGSLPNRTHKHSVRSHLQLLFTSCELTGRWTAASDGPFPANLQSSFALPVPNQVST